MKPLTIEQLKALKVGDWVWVEWQFPNEKSQKRYYQIEANGTSQLIVYLHQFGYMDYGKTWLAYKNKEQAEAKGEIVELPNEKWAITVDSLTKPTNYLVEHRQPIAEFYKGKWHIGYKPIEWRDILLEFDTQKEAEAKLAELKGEK